jgi:hypothetical protein
MSLPSFVPFTTLYASQLNALLNSIPSLTSQLSNNSGFITLAVTSVNGNAGPDITISIPTAVSQLVNDTGYLTIAPVISVNGMTGSVTVITGLASITLTGAVTGVSSNGIISTTLAASGVSVGTYNTVVVNGAGQVTSGSNTQPYDVVMSYIGSPSAGQVFYRAIIPRQVTFSSSLNGSYIICNVNPTSLWITTLSHNGVPIGSGYIAAGSNIGSFSFANTVIFAPGDILEINGPIPADATLADPSITIVGTR